MDIIDMHTHSAFSSDGRSSLEDMIRTAKNMGLKYYGVSEHFDLDEFSRRLYGAVIDEERYFSRARQLQSGFNDGDFTFLVGGEFNFIADDNLFNRFAQICDRFQPDFVVNSVHVVDGAECSRKDYFEGKSKRYAYSRYLEQVAVSLAAPYHFDIVAHLGYVSRKAPYDDKKIRYADFSDLYDDVLRGIIRKNAILEVNTRARGAESEFLPDIDVLARYFELGGRNISFGSDAHFTGDIADKFSLTRDCLIKIGFDHLIVPRAGKHIQILL